MTAEQAETRKVARTKSGGWKEQLEVRSGDRVSAFSSLGLAGLDRETHLLGDHGADKSANTLRLPAACRHEGVQSGASRLLQQYRLGFPALPSGFAARGGFAGLWRPSFPRWPSCSPWSSRSQHAGDVAQREPFYFVLGLDRPLSVGRVRFLL